MGDRLRGRRRTLESGSWARQASRTPSEICWMVWGGCLVSGASETRRDDRGGRDTSASPRLVFARSRLAKKRRSALKESARIEKRAITHLVRELVGVTLVDRLGGEEESGTVLGSHLRRVRWSRRGGAGQSPDDAMAGSWKKLLFSRQTRKTRSRAPARRRRATARDASQFRVDARARRVSVRVVP